MWDERDGLLERMETMQVIGETEEDGFEMGSITGLLLNSRTT